MARHVGHTDRGAAAFGDVLVGREPAVRHQLVADLEGATVVQFPDEIRRGVILCRVGPPVAQIGHVVRGEVAAGEDEIQQLGIGVDELRGVGGQAAQLDEAVVDDDQAARGVDHDQALHHVVHGKIETLRLELRRLSAGFALACEGQFRLGLDPRRLGPRRRRIRPAEAFLAAQLADAEPDEAGEHQFGDRGDAAHPAHPCPPRRQHPGDGVGGGQQQGICATLCGAIRRCLPSITLVRVMTSWSIEAWTR